MANMIFKDNNNHLMSEINKLNLTLNDYEYGYRMNNRNVIQQDDFENYRTISPKMFKIDKCGVCWDYVEYQAIEFEKMGFRITLEPLQEKEYSLYYMQHDSIDGCNPTHTWLGFKLDYMVYSFESSWKSIAGVKPFKNEKLMMDYYIDQQVKHYKKQEGPDYLNKVMIIKFLKHNQFGLDCDSYMNGMYDTGNTIYTEF